MIIDHYSASKLGPTTRIAYTGTAAGVAFWSGLRSLGGVTTPILLVLYSTTNVHVRQSSEAQSRAATVNDFHLIANTYWPLLIESAEDGYVSVIRDTTDGVLRFLFANQLIDVASDS